MLIHLILVEPAGIEPASCDDILAISTCLVRYLTVYRLSTWLADRRLRDYSNWNLVIRPLDRVLTPERWRRSSLFSVRQEGNVAELRQPMRTLRSQLLFWPIFYGANGHPRHAIDIQRIQSKPERPQCDYKSTFSIVIYHCFKKNQGGYHKNYFFNGFW